MQIRTVSDIEAYRNRIFGQMDVASRLIGELSANPLALFHDLKFRQVGGHPVEERPLNVIEQINQTWSYLTALAACRLLLEAHPEADGFEVKPGARARTPHDIFSLKPGICAAEIFAATHPRSNDKLRKDIDKVSRAETHFKYVFFCCPEPIETGWPHTLAIAFEVNGVKVRWLERSSL